MCDSHRQIGGGESAVLDAPKPKSKPRSKPKQKRIETKKKSPAKKAATKRKNTVKRVVESPVHEAEFVDQQGGDKALKNIKPAADSETLDLIGGEETTPDASDNTATETEPAVLDSEEAIRDRVTEILQAAAAEERENDYPNVGKKDKAKKALRAQFHERVLTEIAETLPEMKVPSANELSGNGKSKVIGEVKRRVHTLFRELTLPEAPEFISL